MLNSKKTGHGRSFAPRDGLWALALLPLNGSRRRPSFVDRIMRLALLLNLTLNKTAPRAADRGPLHGPSERRRGPETLLSGNVKRPTRSEQKPNRHDFWRINAFPRNAWPAPPQHSQSYKHCGT